MPRYDVLLEGRTESSTCYFGVAVMADDRKEAEYLGHEAGGQLFMDQPYRDYDRAFRLVLGKEVHGLQQRPLQASGKGGKPVKKRNCRMTGEEKNVHERAVKLRKMTDEKLVEHIDHIREEAYNTGYSEAEAQRAAEPAPGKTLPQLLEQLNAGECKGIKSATAYKIAEFAR